MTTICFDPGASCPLQGYREARTGVRHRDSAEAAGRDTVWRLP